MFRLYLAVFACLIAKPIAAQQYTHVSGFVLDPSGAGILGATVSVVNEETGFRRVTSSNPDGGYAVASLHPGTYKFTVRRDGFRTLVRFGVKLSVAQPVRVDFTLPIGDVRESITVDGSASPLHTEDASVGTVIGRERIAHLPVNGRGLLSLLELAPGTVVTPATRGESGQFTTNGQRPNAHYFTVDGVSVNTGVSGGGVPAQCTGGSLPGMTAFGSLHSIISLEALDEFRVQTSSAVAAFGRLPGAQVSISSRSGSNDFHGAIFHYFRHERLAANDWFANRHGDARAPLRLNHGGASIGGPLRRDRAFFFASYERMDFRQPFGWRAPVPSAALRQSAPEWMQALLGLFPPANGPELSTGLEEWTGRNLRPSRLDSASLRIDAALTPALTVFGRYHQAPSTAEFGVTPLNRLAIRSRRATFGADVRIKPGFVLDLRANNAGAVADSVWMQPDGAALPCLSGPEMPYQLCGRLVRLSVAGVGQVASGHEGRRQQDQWQLFTTANISTGRHQLRAGFDYRKVTPRFRDATGSLSIIAENLNDLLAARNLWISASDPTEGHSISNEFSLFLQDTWRIASPLTVTYGVRWELSPAPEADPPAYFLDPEKGIVNAYTRAVWPTERRNLAPRLGIAYRPSSRARTVIRAGGGLFFSSSLSIATDMVNSGPLNVRQYGTGRNAPFSTILSYGFLPDFRMPYVTQWSASVEHGFSERDIASVAYTGSAGNRLIRREMGGPGNSGTVRVALATNRGKSEYHGLQLQYRRRFGAGFHALASYGWSHSIDNSSSDALLHWAAPGLNPERDRASSDFDVRHAFTGAFTWQPPAGRFRVVNGWALDAIIRARTGFPIDVLNAENPMGLTFANIFRPNLLPGEPVWVPDHAAPRGLRLNREAFQPAGELTQGGLGRNAITGFGMSQVDLAIRRDFPIRNGISMQFRLEAFNALNQANLADPVRFLASPLFGYSASMLNVMLGTGSPGSGLAPIFQVGGPRSVQASLRFTF